MTGCWRCSGRACGGWSSLTIRASGCSTCRLLDQDFCAWSEATLRRLEAPEAAGIARDFLSFAGGLPAGAAADETLAMSGHRLYASSLCRLRDEAGLTFLQPGRFLMPPPGLAPPWM